MWLPAMWLPAMWLPAQRRHVICQELYLRAGTVRYVRLQRLRSRVGTKHLAIEIEGPACPLLQEQTGPGLLLQSSLWMSFQATITANLTNAPTRTLIQINRLRVLSSSRWQPRPRWQPPIEITSFPASPRTCPGLARVYPDKPDDPQRRRETTPTLTPTIVDGCRLP